MQRPIVNTSPEHSVFAGRHLGPSSGEVAQMLDQMGLSDLEELIGLVVPSAIQLEENLTLPAARSEYRALADLREKAEKNSVTRSFIGRGYYDTILPPVIQRNVLENPGWYTAYTPYQAEISQGRLEALLNFQTLICELTGLPVANASLLDEGTAAAEAMHMAAAARPKGKKFFVSDQCFPQTIDVLRTRAEPLGIELVVGDVSDVDFSENSDELIGALFQYPGENGSIENWSATIEEVKSAKGLAIVAADLLALTLLQPPGKQGADIVVGSAQRFGVPMGFGGPHAAFISCSDAHKRRLPGRLIGISKDAEGRPAFRLSLQTREQHIRREKATSNICTAQVLLAVIAGFYGTYHGRDGLRHIANCVAGAAAALADSLKKAGYKLASDQFFDTVSIEIAESEAGEIFSKAENLGLDLRSDVPGRIGISLDEGAVVSGDWKKLADVFELDPLEESENNSLPESLLRDDDFLSQSVFEKYRTESEMLRYLRRLEGKDIALNWSMIPLGSCTMKLNATSQMLPLSWPEFQFASSFCAPVPIHRISGDGR